MAAGIAIRAADLGVRFRRNRRGRRSIKDLFGGATRRSRPDEFWALRHVSFDVRHGEAIGVVGRNGQGKSTLLKLVSGVLLPDEGVVEVHGGVAQGVGGALYERMAYDESGQLLNASFMDFLMPYASEVPHVETDHLETPSPLNPLGIKGAGEAGCIPVSAVIASAIEDAEGFPILSMPISPSELWELRRQHATKGQS